MNTCNHGRYSSTDPCQPCSGGTGGYIHNRYRRIGRCTTIQIRESCRGGLVENIVTGRTGVSTTGTD